MSETYPYPAAEHYVFPTNPIEMMDEHLRRYIDGEQSRSEIIANGHYYKNTRLYTALKDYAAISQHALTGSVDRGHAVIERYRMDFHAGSICALHNNLHPGPHKLKEFVLSNDPLHPLHQQNIDTADNEKFIEDVAADMVAWHNGGAQEFLEQQDEEFTLRLQLIAESTYRGVDSALEREQSFMDGYLFTCNLVWRCAKLRNK